MINLIKQFKWYLLIFISLAIAAYISLLKYELITAQKNGQALTNLLADSIAAETTLKNVVEEQKANIALVQSELAKRDELAAKSATYHQHLDNVIDNQQEQLTRLKLENEQYKNWSVQPVPFVVNELLTNTRNKIQNDSKNRS